jgi:hypothetical protein
MQLSYVGIQCSSIVHDSCLLDTVFLMVSEKSPLQFEMTGVPCHMEVSALLRYHWPMLIGCDVCAW